MLRFVSPFIFCTYTLKSRILSKNAVKFTKKKMNVCVIYVRVVSRGVRDALTPPQ